MTWGLMSKDLWPPSISIPQSTGRQAENLEVREADKTGRLGKAPSVEYLGECNSKRHSCDDPHVSFHETGNQIITALQREYT